MSVKTTKRCTKCNKIKNLSEFHKHKRYNDGHTTNCKDCSKIIKAAYYKDNQSKILTDMAAYREEHRIEAVEYARQYRIDNPEKAKEVCRIQYEKNKETRLENQKRYYWEHKAERIIYNKSYRQQHLEELKEANAIWRKENPGKANALSMKRHAALLQRTPPWLTEDHFKEIQQFYIEAKELSWLSEGGLHVDHVVPLQGKNVSGLHVPWNLQLLPKSMNFSKGNRF